MSESFTQFLGPFFATFVLCLIALGIAAILREGTGDEDRRSFTSSLASHLGILGIVFIPLSAVSIVWVFLRTAVHEGQAPTIIGVIAGAVAAIIVLGRQFVRPGINLSSKNADTEQAVALKRSMPPSLKSTSSVRGSED